MLKRGIQSALLCVVVVVMLGAGKSRFDRLGHEMICTCGCTQILLECNHFGCPSSPGMRDELQAQIATGGSDVMVENWFVAKYGAIVLASPIRGGFDNVAWIMPIAVFLLATIGTAAVVWVWKRRSGVPLSSGAGGNSAASETLEDVTMRERIRRETEYQ
jgi:cytochrome c-type biogenesis protein CcmH/NrfF